MSSKIIRELGRIIEHCESIKSDIDYFVKY